ncbi:MAG: ribose 5-phosphate isomerase B [Chloroflexi bacterium RBG_13_51_18]|nr:MAG: ribose 5-phosphate isomerase B [Chloroflexi bacterium RBG_13_51_18]
MRIAIGNDHRGCNLKETVLKVVIELGHEFRDFGCYTDDAIDYPDIAVQVAEGIVKGEYDRGILICGTGIGMCIAANKVRGIRAAQCYDVFTAHRARLHNNAQICCLAAEEGEGKVKVIVEDFLDTEFEGGRHQKRVDKIKEIEDKQCL